MLKSIKFFSFITINCSEQKCYEYSCDECDTSEYGTCTKCRSGFKKNSVKIKKINFDFLNNSKNQLFCSDNNDSNDMNISRDIPKSDRQIIDNLNKYLINSFQINAKGKNKERSIENKDEVARKVGVGAIIFNDLSNSRIKDEIFDWDTILKISILENYPDYEKELKDYFGESWLKHYIRFNH